MKKGLLRRGRLPLSLHRGTASSRHRRRMCRLRRRPQKCASRRWSASQSRLFMKSSKRPLPSQSNVGLIPQPPTATRRGTTRLGRLLGGGTCPIRMSQRSWRICARRTARYGSSASLRNSALPPPPPSNRPMFSSALADLPGSKNLLGVLVFLGVWFLHLGRGIVV